MLSLQSILHVLGPLRYGLIFPLIILEGPLTTIFCGYLIFLKELHPIFAYLTIIAGDLTGDCLYYSIGRWGRHIAKIQRLTKLDHHFEHYSWRTLVFGKFAHGLGSIILISAGAARMPFRKFVLYNLGPTLIKTLLLLIVGYYFGQAYTQIGSGFERVAIISISVVVLTGFLYYFSTRSTDKKI